MNSFHSIFVKTVFCCFVVGIVTTQCSAQSTVTSTQRRPCGTNKGIVSKLIPQRWKGADFRSACARHDNCYDTFGVKQANCDDRFREDLLASCEHSRRPRQCRRVSELMYKAVDQFGQKAFEQAQQAAR